MIWDEWTIMILPLLKKGILKEVDGLAFMMFNFQNGLISSKLMT